MSVSDKDKKRKYLLFSKDDGRPDQMKPCAFFSSAAGCRSGGKCKFSHDLSATTSVDSKNYDPDVRPVPTAAAIQVVPSSAPTAVAVQQKTIAKEPKKKEKTNHSTAVLVQTQQQPERDSEIEALKKLLQMQQKQLEENQKLLQASLNAAHHAPAVESQKRKADGATPAPNNRKHKSPKNSYPADVTQQPVPNVAQPVSATKPVSDDDSDDSDFIFKAVDIALEQGRTANSPNFVNSASSQSVARTNFVQPVPAVPTTAAVPATNNSIFLGPSDVQRVLATSGTTHATLGIAKSKQKKNVKSDPSANRNSLQLQPTLPVSQVVAPPTTITAYAPVHAPAVAPAAATHIAPTYAQVAPATVRVPSRPAVPTSTEMVPTRTDAVFSAAATNFAVCDFTGLVQKTRADSRFEKDYAFSNTDNTWVASRPVGDWCANKRTYRAIAIDCEMCESTDPVTREIVGNTLIRFSVVDALNPADVLADCLVAPLLPVSNMRTFIHGITLQQVEGLSYSLRQAQAKMLEICTQDTIVIGQSVHFDLKALRFVHSNVVDTSYLYSIENLPNSSPSLRDVAEQILGLKMPDLHDSVQDARVSLYAAVQVLLHGPQPPIKRSNGQSMEAVSAAKLLFVHRIPDICLEDHIRQLIVAQSQIIPVSVSPIIRVSAAPDANSSKDGKGKTAVEFASELHANLAFDSISGPVRADKQNRSQKRVYLKGGGYICVRKM